VIGRSPEEAALWVRKSLRERFVQRARGVQPPSLAGRFVEIDQRRSEEGVVLEHAGVAAGAPQDAV